MKQIFTLTAAALLSLGSASAQLAKDHPCKFLGNITTSYNWQEYCDPQECSSYIYSDYWNQVTCENATKWGSVHRENGTFGWDNADRTYNYCKQKGIIFKFHALIWGSQYPSWIESKSVAETKKAILAWYDEVKKHYPDLEVIDVVNEAIYSGSDYHSPYKKTKIIQALTELANERLGTNYTANTNGYRGNDDYQWIAEAFRLARDRWPNAILIYNDYNTFQWQKTEFINLINGLKACDAPIDAAGNQAHDLNDMGGSQFKNALEEIHNMTQMPQYITEYDIAKNSDTDDKGSNSDQLTRYKEQFPIMWEADYVAGVTLWGWIYGKTWTTNGNSGILENCKERPAFKWLKEYMKSSAALNAKCPNLSSSKINASITLTNTSIEVGETLGISVSATASKEIDHVAIYANDELLVNKYVAPYEWEYVATETGKVTIKVVAFDKEGNTTESSKEVSVCEARKPFNGEPIELPGTIEAEDFDRGCAEIAYHDSDTKDEGAAESGADDYRKDGSGVDVVTFSGGHAIGYTAADEWLEYTVNVKSAGNYSYEAVVASGNANSSFHLELKNGQRYSNLTDKISIPEGKDWTTYSTIKGDLTAPLSEGEQIIRIAFDSPYGNIDKITLNCNNCTTNIDEIAASKQYLYQVYTTTGSYVGSVVVNKLSEMSSALKELTNQEGTFLVRNAETGIAKLYISK